MSFFFGFSSMFGNQALELVYYACHFRIICFITLRALTLPEWIVCMCVCRCFAFLLLQIFCEVIVCFYLGINCVGKRRRKTAHLKMPCKCLSEWVRLNWIGVYWNSSVKSFDVGTLLWYLIHLIYLFRLPITDSNYLYCMCTRWFIVWIVDLCRG